MLHSLHRLDCKALVVLMAVATVFLGLSALVLTFVVLPAFEQLEEQDAKDNLERVRHAVTTELGHLAATAADWAFWDETRDFVQGKRDAYAAENLTDSSLQTLKLDLVYLYDRAGALRWGKAFDRERAPLALDAFADDPLPPDHPLFAGGDDPAGRRGVLTTDRGPYLVAARPLIGSERDKPSGGTLVFGRALDETAVAAMREQTRVDFDLWPSDGVPEPYRTVAAGVEGAEAAVWLPPDSSEVLWSFGTMPDYRGVPALVVGVRTPRTVTAAGASVVEASMIFMVIAAAIDLAVVWLLMRRLILRPIGRLKDHIARSTPGEPQPPLGWTRKDEIGVLARAFDRLQEDVRRHTQALASAMEHVIAAGQAKSSFLASMSHELRTPLNAIIGFSDVMVRELFGPLQNPRYREYANDINTSGEHLLQLINQVLDMSKAESGRLELEEEAIDVGAMAVSACRMVTPQAEKAGVALGMEIEPGLPALTGDRLRLTEVLLNLLSNAVKFTDAGGRVTVTAGCGDSGGLVVSVADTGIGMAVEDIPRAMAPFVQLDNNRGRNLTGTGLGLPLARKMTELHGGRFELASAPGTGTTVTLRFPSARVQRARLTA